MPRPNLPYVNSWFDKKLRRKRYTFRRKDFRKAIPGEPFSPEFMEAYQNLLEESVRTIAVGQRRTKAGSINALAASYYQTHAFTSLAPSSKRTFRGIIDRFREEYGDCIVSELKPKHIYQILQSKQDTPSAANNLLDRIRQLCRHAIELGWIEADPSRDVRPLKTEAKGFHSWTEEEIAKFKKHYAVGTRERLAFDLMLYTGQRRSDIVRMGWQHLKETDQGTELHIEQQKTNVSVEIPIHPSLAGSIAATIPNRENLTFLLTLKTKMPFDAATFGNWFGKVVTKAGLPSRCRSHGLRKAATRRLIEAGCTDQQAMSVTGHTDTKALKPYLQGVRRRKLAHDALQKQLDHSQNRK